MKWVFLIFVGLYLLSAAVLGISAGGLFGQEPDPLSGVLLLPLGLPWNMIAEPLGISSPLVLICAPLINAVILFVIWQRPWS